jgi:phosphoribosylformylglycinamidine synthase
VKGVGEACRALDFPVVSGNVSLYNETEGKAILPTPAIGGVGVLPDLRAAATIALKSDNDVLLLVGPAGGHLGQSIYLREILGREEGPPPPVDLDMERRNGDFIRASIREGLLSAVHDISDGGLLVALTEMALAGDRGACIAVPAEAAARPHAYLFGEDQARYLVTSRPGDLSKVEERARAAGVTVAEIGRVGGDSVEVAGLLAVAIAKLRAAHENWFPAFMAGA